MFIDVALVCVWSGGGLFNSNGYSLTHSKYVFKLYIIVP